MRNALKRLKPLGPLTIAVALSVAAILPIVWILAGSLRPSAEIFESVDPLSWATLFPSEVSLDNYISLLGSGFWLALQNSFWSSLLAVTLGLFLSCLAAYALAVLSFPGRGALFAIVVVGFMIPFEAIAIPLSHQFKEIGLANTMIGLVLPAIGNGLAIFNLRQHFLGMPKSLREAAKMDGASEFWILYAIYAPNSRAAMSNSALLIFLGHWTAYLWPLLVISESRLQLAPIVLARTFGQYSTDFGQNFGGAILLSLLPALFVLLINRFFGGISFTAGEK
ncbi:MAG: carbohydrate ABC transporter permease [Proteobacteria bacterium]|nr:carbohydrate ABC transporter permease [Pseudomonadota bacterium]